MLSQDLDAWYISVPGWFRQTGPDTFKDFDPFDYAYPNIPVVLSCAYAAEIYNQDPPPFVLLLAMKLLCTCRGHEEDADLMIIPNVWSAALFLRKRTHRETLENDIRQTIKNRDFFFWKFCLAELHHGWSLALPSDPCVDVPRELSLV